MDTANMTGLQGISAGSFALGDPSKQTGNLQGSADDSLFQKLITQMIMQKSMAGSRSETLNALCNGKSVVSEGGLSQLLALAGQSDLSGLKITGKEAGTVNTDEKSGKNAQQESNGEMEMMQAMMLGLSGGMMVPQTQQENSTEQSDTKGAAGQVVLTGVSSGEGNLNATIGSSAGQVGSDGNIGFNVGNTVTGAEQNTVSQESGTEKGDLRSGIFPKNGSAVNGSFEHVLQTNGEQTKSVRSRSMTADSQQIDGQNKQNDKAGASLNDKAGASLSGVNEAQMPKHSSILSSETNRQDGVFTDAYKEAGLKSKTAGDDKEMESSGRSLFHQEVLSPAGKGESAAGDGIDRTAMNQTAVKAEPYNQISDEILTRLEQKGSTEFRMQLTPKDLGQIDIKLKLDDGKLVIDILAANAKTQSLLTGQVDKLISSMGLQNVKVESVQISQQINQQSQDNQSQNFNMNFGMDFSQHRNHESSQREFLKGMNLTGTADAQQVEGIENEPVYETNPVRYRLNRMNYTA